MSDAYPFRWYGTSYFDCDEVSLRILFLRDANRGEIEVSLAALPYPALQWCPLPVANVEPVDEPAEPGHMQAHLHGPWLNLYVNLFDVGDIREDIEGLRATLRALHRVVPIAEVVEGHGEVFAYPDVDTDDEWTGWSIAQRPPTRPPDAIRHAFWTPYDQHLEAALDR